MAPLDSENLTNNAR